MTAFFYFVWISAINTLVRSYRTSAVSRNRTV
nr:MAG TPA: hypothetical protein [Bacteriophage sp.]